MAKEPQLLPGVPRERVYVKVGHGREIAPIIKNLKFPPRPPTPGRGNNSLHSKPASSPGVSRGGVEAR